MNYILQLDKLSRMIPARPYRAQSYEKESARIPTYSIWSHVSNHEVRSHLIRAKKTGPFLGRYWEFV